MLVFSFGVLYTMKMKTNFNFKSEENTSLKYILRLFQPLCMIFLLMTGCHTAYAGEEGTLSVVTTVFPPYDFAWEITNGVEGVSVTQLLRPGMESHTFDPTPADMLTVEHCDVFIYTGGESDAWVDTLLDAVNNPDMRVIRMIECVDHVENMPSHMEHDHDHQHDADHVEYDEHVWTHPQNAIRICESIAKTLCDIDHAHADMYESNLAVYTDKLWELDRTIAETVSEAERNTLIFGDHFPFSYLCKGYGISYRAAFSGCAAESEVSARTLASLIDQIKAENIPVVCKIELSNAKVATAISEQTGAEIQMLHSCHNRTAKEAKAGKTYLDLMYENVNVLRIALGKKDQES